MLILFIFIGIQCLYFVATFNLYKLAGRKAWEASVPFYNILVFTKIINRPMWWSFLLLLPVVNILVFFVFCIELLKSYSKTTTTDVILMFTTLGVYTVYLNYKTNTLIYIENRNVKPNSKLEDSIGSVLFAVIAATIVHTYIVQPFTIPSSSLEKTLLVGDFLFVSKVHYGARVPSTLLSAPMVHDTIPVIGVKSYFFDDNYSRRFTSVINKIQLPYFRFPSFQKIKRNDIVVFNQPADTLLDMNNFHPDRYYNKPIDKKTNLVKRCVAISGDTLEIKKGYVFVNGQQLNMPEYAKPQYNFYVDTGGNYISQKVLKNVFNARDGLKHANGNFRHTSTGGYVLTLTDSEAEQVKKHALVNSVTKLLKKKGVKGEVFPHKKSLHWNIDNYGPIYIPEKNKTVQLNKDNISFYKRIISVYEGNTLAIKGDVFTINGEVKNTYTFQQNYYWMMGDNRQNSLDSRAWGFVPFDHVVGKPVFIWMSVEENSKNILQKIRWKRLFTTVHGTDEKTSYFPYFIAFLIVYYVVKKRRDFKK